MDQIPVVHLRKFARHHGVPTRNSRGGLLTKPQLIGLMQRHVAGGFISPQHIFDFIKYLRSGIRRH